MKNLYLGDRGVLVQYLQLALNRAGFAVEIDGEFRRDTCQALQAFRRSVQEEESKVGCYVDQEVWKELLPYLKGYKTHIVGRGDSVWQIAQQFGTTQEMILTANPNIEIQNLQVGTRIYVPLPFALVSEQVDYSFTLTQWILEGLGIRYPFLRSGSAGESVIGRPLSYLQIGEGETQIFYNASFHANEWITTPVLLTFAEEYAQAYAEKGTLYGASAQALFQTYQLYLMPMVNPDGVDLVTGALQDSYFVEQTKEIAAGYPQIPYPDGWKANIDGVDLNLQFPAGWEEARQIKYEQGYTTPAPRDYVGTAPLTAPESLWVYRFTQQHDFRLILAYHTQGEVIYWKYLDFEPDHSRRIADYFGNVSGYEVEETPVASGYAGYKDWFIATYNRPGYTIEAGLGENPLPMSQFAQIYEANKGILLGGMIQI